MINLIQNTLTLKRIKLPKVTTYEVSNPSIILKGNDLFAIYRGKNYHLKFNGYRKKKYSGHEVSFEDNQNYFAYIDCCDELKLTHYGLIEDRHIRSNGFALNGLADIRIFYWHDEVYALCVCKPNEFKSIEKISTSRLWERILKVVFKNKFKKTRSAATTSAAMLLCKLEGKTLEEVSLLPSRQAVEKNWMPWVNKDKLYFIYHHDPFEILGFEGSTIVNSFTPQMQSRLKDKSGGSAIVPFGENFIGITHHKKLGRLHDRGRNESLVQYTHQVIIYGPTFEVLDVSPDFTFEGERVEFCCGIAVTKEFVAISYGVWDVEAVVIKLDLKEFLSILCLDKWIDSYF